MAGSPSTEPAPRAASARRASLSRLRGIERSVRFSLGDPERTMPALDRPRRAKNNNENSNGGEQGLKLQEFDEDVYDKMKLHEKMYDEANAWGVSLGINKKVLRVKGGGVRRGKEKGVISAKQMAYAQFFADPKLKKKQKRAMKNVERGVRRGTSSSTSRKMMMTE